MAIAHPGHSNARAYALRTLLLFALAFTALLGWQSNAQAAPCGSTAAPPVTYQHVVWVVMENHSYADIVGSPSAPYINSVARSCGLPLRYYALAHPSLPNYLGMTSGSLHSVTDDGSPAQHPISGASIFSQVSWRSLEESMTSNCFLGDSGNYVVHHNPAAYYTNVRTACGSQDIPLGSTPDISAQFTFVTPNLCNDMHNCSIQTGDTWLSTFLPKILNSATYAAGQTAVFVTWDEDEDGTWKVPTLVIAPTVPVNARPNTIWNHYSLLRTTEEMLGVPCLAGACNVASMRSAFHM
jgi:hypothetical protein